MLSTYHEDYAFVCLLSFSVCLSISMSVYLRLSPHVYICLCVCLALSLSLSELRVRLVGSIRVNMDRGNTDRLLTIHLTKNTGL